MKPVYLLAEPQLPMVVSLVCPQTTQLQNGSLQGCPTPSIPHGL